MQKITIKGICQNNYQKWVDAGQKENADLAVNNLPFNFPINGELIGNRIIIESQSYHKNWFLFSYVS